MLDIDHFKRVNDHEGHPAGDRTLKEFASRITRAVRDGDMIGRWGGEEFVIIAPQTDRRGGLVLGEHIRAAIAERPFDLGDHCIDVTVSIGCASGVETAQQLVDRADKALYQSKDRGRNRVTAA